MQKLLLMSAAVVLVAGCGKVENGAYKDRPKPTDINESTPTTNTNEVVGTTAKPVKELTLEEKIIGEYEITAGKDTVRMILLRDGIVESYLDGNKNEKEGKWGIGKDEELHIEDNSFTFVYRINQDGSITLIARMSKDGKREKAPKGTGYTAKKIK